MSETKYRLFTADDQWKGSGMYPNAILWIATKSSEYQFRIEGGGWETSFTLAYTTNTTAQQWIGERITLGSGVSGTVQTLITEVLYGRQPVKALNALQQLVGRTYGFTVWDWKGSYGCDKEQVARWNITEIQSIQLIR